MERMVNTPNVRDHTSKAVLITFNKSLITCSTCELYSTSERTKEEFSINIRVHCPDIIDPACSPINPKFCSVLLTIEIMLDLKDIVGVKTKPRFLTLFTRCNVTC